MNVMINFLEAYEVFKGPLGEEAAKRLTDLLSEMREEMIKTIVNGELSRLRNAVEQLAEAQRRTEERLESLAERMDQLAEAQKRTEERLNQLAEAQRKTEERLDQLAIRMDQLAEAQRKTEERLDQLAEAQRKTEERLDQLVARIDQLAEAQGKTEERLNQLAEAQRQVEEQIRKLVEAQMRTEHRIDVLSERVEGVSHTVGYTLEDKAIRSLPPLLERDHNIKLTEGLVRRYVTLPRGRTRQINIYGRGRQDGTDILVLGECKVRASKKEVRDFLRLADRIEKYEGVKAFRLFVCYDFRPEIEDMLKELGVCYYWSYELD
jgi:prefoldin subunit 5